VRRYSLTLPQSSALRRIALKTPPPNLEEVWGRIKEGAE